MKISNEGVAEKLTHEEREVAAGEERDEPGGRRTYAGVTRAAAKPTVHSSQFTVHQEEQSKGEWWTQGDPLVRNSKWSPHCRCGDVCFVFIVFFVASPTGQAGSTSGEDQPGGR